MWNNEKNKKSGGFYHKATPIAIGGRAKTELRRCEGKRYMVYGGGYGKIKFKFKVSSVITKIVTFAKANCLFVINRIKYNHYKLK